MESPAGPRVVEYFERLAAAYSADDLYGVLDYYEVDAVEQSRTTDARENPRLIRDRFGGNRADFIQRIQLVLVGNSEALRLRERPEVGDFEAVVALMAGGSIARETVFVDAVTLEQSLRSSPEVIDHYADLYRRYALAWSAADTGAVAELYAPEAVLRDPAIGELLTGVDAIAATSDGGSFEEVTVAGVEDRDDPDAGPALYLDPVQFGHDPGRAVAVYRSITEDGCRGFVGVRWEVVDGLIEIEDRFVEAGTLDRCYGGDPPTGWWTGLEIPGPRDQVVTGVVETESGRSIEIFNGTDHLEGLVRHGFDRFVQAGLAEPLVDSVTFEPTRRCEGVSGRVIRDEAGRRDVVLCIFEADLCRDAECASRSVAAEAGMMHELAHAWMLDQTDGATEQRVLELSGRAVWNEDGVAWQDRGVEYAAEAMAWGLAAEELGLVRLGRPPCEELAAVFRVLTGTEPLEGRGDCAGP